jgi:5-methyltetrahydrofolate--homocysteine methyltransferase
MGLAAGVAPEEWTLSHPDKIENLHLAYLRSGADIIKTNTFGVNSLKYENYEAYIDGAMKIAHAAQDKYEKESGERKFIAFDIGPLGKLLEPLGTLSFDECVEIYSNSARLADASGADCVLIETLNDAREAKAAVIAFKENCALPIFVTTVYDESGRLMTGADPETMVTLLEGLGVDALGANCSLGPDKLLPIVKRLSAVSSTPIIINPNAGLPDIVCGKSVYKTTPREFAEQMKLIAESGATLLGGCCGTTPEYIKAMIEATEAIPYALPDEKKRCAICSFAGCLEIGRTPVLVGERINPTGKPRLKEALRDGNMSYILSEAIAEEEAGAHALDINVGLPGIDEAAMMRRVVEEVQGISALPLQLDSNNPTVLEGAMRIYSGTPLINSVNGEEKSMSSVFPLAKKYGGVIIALTMDENGIPKSAEGRVEIAEKIARRAAEYGIPPYRLVFDPLALSVSSDKDAARVTLDAVRMLTERGYATSLGVSNISFGLPEREKLNAAFFGMALSAGLKMAIINPNSRAMLDTYHAHTALSGLDCGFKKYIAYAQGAPSAEKAADTAKSLKEAIVKGLVEDARRLAAEYAASDNPTLAIQGEIVPALAEVGELYDTGKAFLPTLLISSEAASAAFAEIKRALPVGEAENGKKIVLATVKGDIHDIGKNIVKALLESHGNICIDLGRDVPPEKILEAVGAHSPAVVALSALMTTTLGAMEETVRLIKAKFPEVRVMVGGAVLTADYAEKIGADLYAKDAMEALKRVNLAD